MPCPGFAELIDYLDGDLSKDETAAISDVHAVVTSALSSESRYGAGRMRARSPRACSVQ